MNIQTKSFAISFAGTSSVRASVRATLSPTLNIGSDPEQPVVGAQHSSARQDDQ
jgi:hypothetical protein